MLSGFIDMFFSNKIALMIFGGVLALVLSILTYFDLFPIISGWINGLWPF